MKHFGWNVLCRLFTLKLVPFPVSCLKIGKKWMGKEVYQPGNNNPETADPVCSNEEKCAPLRIKTVFEMIIQTPFQRERKDLSMPLLFFKSGGNAWVPFPPPLDLLRCWVYSVPSRQDMGTQDTELWKSDWNPAIFGGGETLRNLVWSTPADFGPTSL